MRLMAIGLVWRSSSDAGGGTAALSWDHEKDCCGLKARSPRLSMICWWGSGPLAFRFESARIVDEVD